MNAHKKKPRQRNRPKNKANRIARESFEVIETSLKNAKSETQQKTSFSSVTETVRVTDEENPVTISKAVEEPETAGHLRRSRTPQNLRTTEATLALFENNHPINLIQRLLRAKLLPQSSAANKSTDETNNNGIVTSKSLMKATSTSAVNVKQQQQQPLNKSKLKGKLSSNDTNKDECEKDAFITNLQKQMENVLANGSTDLPNTLLGNLQKLVSQDPVSDVESSDEDDEYIEYMYKPRQYFLVSLCNLCKCDLRSKARLQCSRCKLTFYCSAQHMKNDEDHKQLCYALRQVAENCGGHIFYKCSDFTTEQFRSYRIVTIRKMETIMNRPLSATEQEVILFPRICTNVKCREYRFNRLIDCENCGQVAFCKDNPEHRGKQHKLWCTPYQLFKDLIMFQEKFGRLDPSLPSKVLKDLPSACCNTKQILNKLGFDMHDRCEYAALSQISTCPLTAWYALKLCDQLKQYQDMTIHLIGAEVEFEVDILHKWELFFLHITPSVMQLNIVFIGPELNPRNISFEQLKKTKSCRICRKNDRTVKYYFHNKIYHDYCQEEAFLKPHLICFFNAGVYRSTGYLLEDTWPETISAAANLKCPIVVTSYTEYEAPLDMSRFVQESNRRLSVVLPPIINPFASEKPERNFISDEDAPLMFKNYYCFVVE